MNQEHETYGAARAAAQRFADETGLSVGIEAPFQDLPKHFSKWTTRLLPWPQHRFGFELRIECVDPESRKP